VERERCRVDPAAPCWRRERRLGLGYEGASLMGDDKKGQKEAYKARKKEAKAAAKRAKARSAEPSSERAADVRGVSSSPDASSVKRAAPSGPLRRLVGQGIFQLVVKIIAGLIVAYILIRLGPR
jgi:hypothetical protein